MIDEFQGFRQTSEKLQEKGAISVAPGDSTA